MSSDKDKLLRLAKIEDKLMKYAEEEGIFPGDIEWDIIPDEKMLEIMAYHIPGQVSNWKFGRDYERLKTINENTASGLPYEVVINSDPFRAYLMKSNTFGVQVLVMAHVIGHAAFMTMNKYFEKSKKDIIEYMSLANKRFNEYERRFGIDDVEKVIDAGHSIQFHSSPFDNETEKEKLERVFMTERRRYHKVSTSEFADLLGNTEDKVKKDVERFNQELYKRLKSKTPVEPTSDLLRYIIDNSNVLDDWEVDILETLRVEGRYYWPMIKTKFMNEGFATFWHERFMDRLYKEGLINTDEHAEFGYSNSLVKAMHPMQMNPYLVGSKIYDDIEERWNKGKHGRKWEECQNWMEKENWDTKAMEGRKKVIEVAGSYTDWFFVQDFLTPELVDDLNLYIYVLQNQPDSYDFVRTKHTAKEVAKIIINSFSHSHIPLIEVVDGDFNKNGDLLMIHRHSGADLALKYASETLKHVKNLWGDKQVMLETIVNKKSVRLRINEQGKFISENSQGISEIEKKQGIWNSNLHLSKTGNGLMGVS